jgi:hypothetical protein
LEHSTTEAHSKFSTHPRLSRRATTLLPRTAAGSDGEGRGQQPREKEYYELLREAGRNEVVQDVARDLQEAIDSESLLADGDSYDGACSSCYEEKNVSFVFVIDLCVTVCQRKSGPRRFFLPPHRPLQLWHIETTSVPVPGRRSGLGRPVLGTKSAALRQSGHRIIFPSIALAWSSAHFFLYIFIFPQNGARAPFLFNERDPPFDVRRK